MIPFYFDYTSCIMSTTDCTWYFLTMTDSLSLWQGPHHQWKLNPYKQEKRASPKELPPEGSIGYATHTDDPSSYAEPHSPHASLGLCWLTNCFWSLALGPWTGIIALFGHKNLEDRVFFGTTVPGTRLWEPLSLCLMIDQVVMTEGLK